MMAGLTGPPFSPSALIHFDVEPEMPSVVTSFRPVSRITKHPPKPSP